MILDKKIMSVSKPKIYQPKKVKHVITKQDKYGRMYVRTYEENEFYFGSYFVYSSYVGAYVQTLQ